jgi:hypothetical protein
MKAKPGNFAKRIQTVAICLCVLALFSTAALKLASLWIHRSDAFGRHLGAPNVAFPFLSDATVLFLAAVVEIALSIFLLVVRSNLVRYAVLAWLTVAFGAYRYVLYTIQWGAPCGCAGVWEGHWQSVGDKFAFGALLLLAAIGWTGFLMTLVKRKRLPLLLFGTNQTIENPVK